MMELTAVQQDALDRAAQHRLRPGGRFAVATDRPPRPAGSPARLDPPDRPSRGRARAGRQDDVASVHQIFSGPVAGDALLMLDPSGAAMLKELLTDEPALPLAIDASAREVITEVGNILLNACLGTFGNLLNVQVSFSVSRI